jgi:rRNA maturation endonuclease Nob1
LNEALPQTEEQNLDKAFIRRCHRCAQILKKEEASSGLIGEICVICGQYVDVSS